MFRKRTIEERRKKYHCDGYCYGCNLNLDFDDPDRKPMCPAVETCPETCVGEFFATIFAGLCYLVIMVFLMSPFIFIGYKLVILFIEWLRVII